MKLRTSISPLFWGASLLLCVCSNAFATDPGLFEPRSHRGEAGSMVYRLFHAKNTVAGRKYPLIVFLHGSGERGNDNELQIKHNFPDVFISEKGQAENPCFIAVPQCPKDSSWSAETLHGVKGILDSLYEELPIDKNRLYAVGISMGGRGTFNLLIEYPSLFAAAVPCAGGSDASLIADMSKTPMWLHCASHDKSIQPYYDLVAALKKQGDNVVCFKSNRNGSDPSPPWSTIVSSVAGGAKFLFCETLDGTHPDSWNSAWKNDQMPIWLFSKSKAK